MTDHRAAFDASITFGNGGDLTVHGFRVDVPSPDVTEDEIAALFVASLGLLMTDGVELSGVRVFPEPHKGTRGGPSDRATTPAGRSRLLPLDTPATRLELPPPAAPSGAGAALTEAGDPVTDESSPAAARGGAAGGDGAALVEVGAAGGPVTDESSPAAARGGAAGGAGAGLIEGGAAEDAVAGEPSPVGARAAGAGRAGVVDGGAGSAAGVVVARAEGVAESGGEGPARPDGGLARTVELPAVVVRASGASWEAIGVGALAPFAVRGHAVLLETQAGESLTEDAARWLVSQAAALVATDAATLGASRKILLEAGIPVAESLTGLDALPPAGAFFTALSPHTASGPAPARAYARVP